MRLSRSAAKRVANDVMAATLGDLRRNRRAVQVVEAMMREPWLSLPRALGSDAAVQGCYRLMNNPEVTFEALHAAHAAATVTRAEAVERVLVLHDTTPCSFEHLDPEALGYLQTGKAGFNLHYALVLQADAWKRPLGVIHAETVHRPEKPRSRRSKEPKKKKKNGHETAKKQDKEFARWWRGIDSAQQLLGGVDDVIHIADRESDSYELMSQLVSVGMRFIFRVRVAGRRGRQADAASEQWSTVQQVARACDGVLEREVPLSRRRGGGPPGRGQAHPPRKMRLATLRFAATRVVIPRPVYLSAPHPQELKLSLVHVYEADPPEGEAPVEWLLYTTETVDTREQSAGVVDAYRARWTIEEFNAAVKTGCAYEAREFESRHALLNMLALSLPVACEAMWLRSRARSSSDAPADEVLSPLQLDVVRHFSSYRLGSSPTVTDALLAVAALGGHLRRNGPPGWKVLIAGMATLQAYAAGWEAALARGNRRRRSEM